MIDNDTEYMALKKQCNNALFQFTEPSGFSKKMWPNAPDTVGCPHWIFSEEYALTQSNFELYWHTPGVCDGGIYCTAKILSGDRLLVESKKDGFVTSELIDRAEVKLERYANRMFSIEVDGKIQRKRIWDWGSGKISISYFNDPDYKLWSVQYFDYQANAELFQTVRARSKNEAKVITWKDSCYKHKDINPETFKVSEYFPHVITRASVELVNQDEMDKQMAICEHYDKENE